MIVACDPKTNTSIYQDETQQLYLKDGYYWCYALPPESRCAPCIFFLKAGIWYRGDDTLFPQKNRWPYRVGPRIEDWKGENPEEEASSK